MSVPPCLLLICMLIYCTHSQMKNSVIFNTNSTSKSYPYAYTTLGNPPTTTLHADVVILSKLNLSNDCWFTKNTNVSLLQGKIVILDSFPDWFSCTSLPEGRPSVFGRIVQRAGAVGVIMQAHESFYYGSFLSIDSTIKVPFVAIQGPQFYDLVSNSSTVLSVEFPAISSKDASFLTTLHACFIFDKILLGTLFGANFLMYSFLLYDDIKYERRKSKKHTHRIYLKAFALVAALFALLYISVDPFGFKGIRGWNSQFVITMHSCLYGVVLMLILQLWIATTTGGTATKVLESRLFIYAIHILPMVIMILAFVQGWARGNRTLALFYWYSFMILYILCGFGFIFFGRNIITILRKSGNSNHKSEPVKRKIIIFIICYLVLTYSATILYSTNGAGFIFSLLGSMFATSSLQLAAGFILFLPPVLKRRRVQHRLSETTSTSAGTPTGTQQRPITCSIELQPMEIIS